MTDYKQMSLADLMKPRYKVIANYPGSRCNIGDVMIQHKFDDGSYVYFNKYGHHCGLMNRDIENENFKHLFKKLEWWEERKIEEMPKYLRLVNEKMLEAASFYGGIIVKVKGWKFLSDIWCAEINNSILRADYYIPAIEEEYLNQNKK